MGSLWFNLPLKTFLFVLEKIGLKVAQAPLLILQRASRWQASAAPAWWWLAEAYLGMGEGRGARPQRARTVAAQGGVCAPSHAP